MNLNKGGLISDFFDGTKRIGEDICFDDLADFSIDGEVVSSVIRMLHLREPQHRLDYKREVIIWLWIAMPQQ